MNEKTLKVNNIRVNKKEFDKSKQPIDLDLVTLDQIVASDKKHSDDGEIKTNFLGNEIPKENMHYICIACITIDSIMKMDKKYFPQVYLEECKYRVKKIQMSRFINAELESDSESDSEAESKSDTELKSNSDSE